MLQALLIVATNDPAERALKTLKNHITRFNNEKNLQHSGVEERKLTQAYKLGQISKANFMNITRPTNNN